MSNSNFTGRASRTMTEAFGAHCSEAITTQHDPMKRAEKLFCVVVGAIGLAALALMLAGVIA